MRVAVVSRDSKNIDEHFGRAENFLVYDVEENTNSFLEKRQSSPLSEGDPKHPFNPERFEGVYNVISDCKVLLCLQVGTRPGEELKKRGIEPVAYQGTIEDALKKAGDFLS